MNQDSVPRRRIPGAIRSFFALNSSMIALLAMVVLVGMGEKMAERFLPLYLMAVGGTTWAVGSLNGMDNLLSALYSFPGGYLSDLLGYKKALIVFNLVAMAGYVIVILVPTWWAVLVGAVFFISWTAISLPAIMSLVSKAVPKDKRTMGVSLHSLTRRIPMALGPVVGGALIQVFGRIKGVRISFGVALLLGAVAILLEVFFIKEDPDAGKKDRAVRLKDSIHFITPDLRNLLISDILIRFSEQIPYAFVVLWVVDRNGMTPLQFGVLTTIEMITAMLVYIPIAILADRNSKKPFVLTTFVFFTAFPIVLYFSRSFPALCGAFVLRGLKEYGEPTRKALIMDLAPENAKASTFGTYYLLRDVIVSVAAFGAAWLWNRGPGVNFFTAAAFGAAGTIYFAVFGRDLKSAA
ncbi:MAG: MFS transporter [Coprothermobacter sp.]|jgi:MFS family permease|nr:MFS transporter [Coprothermobacter sp.]